MKHVRFYLATILGLISTSLAAQECDHHRYYEEVFPYIEKSADIQYGENVQASRLNPTRRQALWLDLYEPSGDTLGARPLIIWAFGGGFVLGSKTSPDIVALSQAFAKRGYVTAAIDYRLSADLVVNSELTNLYEAVLKATHDMAAAIRFFYRDAATVNAYRIDTTRIYIGGVSAGAITALQIAHFDELSEVPMEIDSLFQAWGGFEGNSGNEGYSQDIAGVINLCGAVVDTAWINPSIPTPIVSMHGTQDDIVPYGSDTITLLDINLAVDGSSSIHAKLDQHGMTHDLYTWQGAGHTPFVLNQPAIAEAYMDTTIEFVRDFLYDLVCEGLTSTNEPFDQAPFELSLFPNPNKGTFVMQLESDESMSMLVLDQLGRQVYSRPAVRRGTHRFELDLPVGVYLVKVYSPGKPHQLSRRMVVH